MVTFVTIVFGTRSDLQKMKDLTNQMCKERGFHVPEKGKHFDGNGFELGTTTTWSKDKYHLFEKNKAKSYVVDCLYAVMNAKQNSFSKDDFINEMSDRGWNTTWVDNRKNITFINSQGQKVRASNLSKTFSIDLLPLVRIYELKEKNLRNDWMKWQLYRFYGLSLASSNMYNTSIVKESSSHI